MNQTLLIPIRQRTISNGNKEALFNEVMAFISKKTPESYNQKKEILIQFLKENNLKQTPERFIILEKICNSTGIFTTDEIHSKSSKELQMIRQTVANTFSILIKAKIIQRATEPDERFKTIYYSLIS